jgi:hypothetical protein
LALGLTATNLWIPDKQLFDEIAKKRRLKPAQLAGKLSINGALPKDVPQVLAKRYGKALSLTFNGKLKQRSKLYERTYPRYKKSQSKG